MPDLHSSRNQNFATPRLLIDEQPLQVLRSLAVAVGLNEAIILQQLHYEMRLERHMVEGVSWVYHTYEQWQKQDFPFWSTDTIKRAIHRLEKLGLLDSTMRFNHSPIDKRKWYTINYEKLAELSVLQAIPLSTMQNAPTSMQDVELDDAKCIARQGNMPPLPKIPTKNTTQEQDPLPTGEETALTREEYKPQLPLAKPGKPPRASRRCPLDYQPSQTVYTWAIEHHPEIDVDAALEALKDYEFASGHTDWDATLRTWIRNEAKRRPSASRHTMTPETASIVSRWLQAKE